MDTFQQPKITGYRQLTEEEAALMNEIKARGIELGQLIDKVGRHVGNQRSDADKLIGSTGSDAEKKRLDGAQPERWSALAKTHFQEGLMALTRAVAQPSTF